MLIKTAKDPAALASKRRLEMELVMLSSDQKRLERSVMTLRAEQRSLGDQKKRLLLDIDRNAETLHTQSAKLEQVTAEIVAKKKHMNLIR